MSVGNMDIDDMLVFAACAAAYAACKTYCDEEYDYTTEDFQVAFSRIQLPSDSPFGVLLNSHDDGSYKIHLGLKATEFDGLHNLFKNEYLEKTQADELHPLETELVLALVFKWRHDKRDRMGLDLLFGADIKTILKGVQFGSDILDDMLSPCRYSRRR